MVAVVIIIMVLISGPLHNKGLAQIQAGSLIVTQLQISKGIQGGF